MKHTKFENITDVDSMDVIKWLQTKFGKDLPMSVGLNHNGSIRHIDIGKKLSNADKKLITDKFPELENKEIE